MASPTWPRRRRPRRPRAALPRPDHPPRGHRPRARDRAPRHGPRRRVGRRRPGPPDARDRPGAHRPRAPRHRRPGPRRRAHPARDLARPVPHLERPGADRADARGPPAAPPAARRRAGHAEHRRPDGRPTSRSRTSTSGRSRGSACRSRSRGRSTWPALMPRSATTRRATGSERSSWPGRRASRSWPRTRPSGRDELRDGDPDLVVAGVEVGVHAERDRVPQALVVLELELAGAGVPIRVVEQLVDGHRVPRDLVRVERPAHRRRAGHAVVDDRHLDGVAAAEPALAAEQERQPIGVDALLRPDRALPGDLVELGRSGDGTMVATAAAGGFGWRASGRAVASGFGIEPQPDARIASAMANAGIQGENLRVTRRG